MTINNDFKTCEATIRTGSKSFYAASKLLPQRVAQPAKVLYAFCRLADDAVDLNTQKADQVLRLRDRLDLVYQGKPLDSPVDRAFTALVEHYEMPRALPSALLEGLAWDAKGRRYESLSELRSYSARVAAAVGAMMCVLMGVRQRDALARACDLGVAMQLTNIARDVGEDARAGRLYLPTLWLAGAGIEPDAFLANPRPSPQLARLIKRLLAEANRLYARSEAGITRLPLDCRPGILAARYIYAAIGRQVARADYETISKRATTSLTTKLTLLTGATLQAMVESLMPQSATLHARALDEVAFLVDAAAEDPLPQAKWGDGWAGGLISVLADLEAQRGAQLG